MLGRWLSVSLVLVLCGVLLVGFVPSGSCVTVLAYSKAFADADNDWLMGADDNLCVAVVGNGQYLHSLILSIKEYTLEGNVVGDIYGVVFSNSTNILESTSPMDESVLDGSYRNCSFIFSGTLFLVSGVTYYVGIHEDTSSSRVQVAEDNGVGGLYYHSPDLLSSGGQVPVYAIYTSTVYGSGGGGSYVDVVYDGLGLYVSGSPHFLVDTLCVAGAIHTCDQGYGYGFTGQIFDNYVENVTAGGVFNVTWIGFEYTLGQAYDPTMYDVYTSGLLIDGVFSFDLYVEQNYTSNLPKYTALRVNYTLDGETEVSALYMFKFEPPLYNGWTSSPAPLPTLAPGSSASEALLFNIMNVLLYLAVLMIPAILLGHAKLMGLGAFGYIFGVVIGASLGTIFIAGFPVWILFTAVVGMGVYVWKGR